jgi:hypothetical protein
MATHEEAIVMGEHEDYRAGHEARKEVVAAPAAALRHDEMIRRHLGGAFYDVLRRRREHPAPPARGAEDSAPPEDVHGD